MGIPDYLLSPIWDWMAGLVYIEDPIYGTRVPDSDFLQAAQVALRMHPTLDWSRGADSAVYSLNQRVSQDREFAIDFLDFLVRFRANDLYADKLNQTLALGGSEWEVIGDEGSLMLSKRMVGPVAEVVEGTRSTSERAHLHLMSAWAKLAGRSPDPSGAYKEAIRAVEAAAKPVIAPSSTFATLGKMIGDIRANRRSGVSSWTTPMRWLSQECAT